MENFHILSSIVGFAILAIIVLMLKVLIISYQYLLKHVKGFSYIRDNILVAIVVIAFVYLAFDFIKMLYCIGEAILGYS